MLVINFPIEQSVQAIVMLAGIEVAVRAGITLVMEFSLGFGLENGFPGASRV